MELKDRIALARKRAGMTQEQLGERLGVTRQSVSKWESGQTNPDVTYLTEMCRVLEVSSDWLLLGKEERQGGTTRPCANCGEQVGVQARFCGTCGVELQSSVIPQRADRTAQHLNRALLFSSLALLAHPMMHGIGYWLFSSGFVRDSLVLAAVGSFMAAALVNLSGRGLWEREAQARLNQSPVYTACLMMLGLAACTLVFDMIWLGFPLNWQGEYRLTIFDVAENIRCIRHVIPYGEEDFSRQLIGFILTALLLALHGLLLKWGDVRGERNQAEEDWALRCSMAVMVVVFTTQIGLLLRGAARWSVYTDWVTFTSQQTGVWVVLVVGIAGVLWLNRKLLAAKGRRLRLCGWTNLLFCLVLAVSFLVWFQVWLGRNLGGQNFIIHVRPNTLILCSLTALLPRRLAGVLTAKQQAQE